MNSWKIFYNKNNNFLKNSAINVNYLDKSKIILNLNKSWKP